MRGACSEAKPSIFGAMVLLKRTDRQPLDVLVTWISFQMSEIFISDEHFKWLCHAT